MQSVQRPQTHEGRKSWWMFAVWWDHHELPNDAIAAHHCPIPERASPRGMEGLHRASSGKQANKVWTRFAAGSEASVTCFECHRRCDRISSSVEPVGPPLAAPTGADRSAGHQPRRADCCSSPICCWWKRGQAELMPRRLVTDERREADAAGRSRNDKRGEHGLAWIVDCRRLLQGC